MNGDENAFKDWIIATIYKKVKSKLCMTCELFF